MVRRQPINECAIWEFTNNIYYNWEEKRTQGMTVFCLFFMTVSSVIKYSVNILCDPLCLSDNSY